jgi:hypothetical protein
MEVHLSLVHSLRWAAAAVEPGVLVLEVTVDVQVVVLPTPECQELHL